MTSTAGSRPPSRPILILNGAESRTQAVLEAGGELLGSAELDAAGRANQYLAPAADHLLRALGLTVRDLAGVACVRGPGGFTGLRMTLALGLGLARAAGLPMAGLDYLPLLAAGPGPLLAGTLAVWVRSRTRQVYAQCFAVPDLTPLGGPEALDSARAASQAVRLAQAGPLFLLGSGVRANGQILQDMALDSLTTVLPGAWDAPLPAILARAAAGARFGPDPVEPLYLRASDAEDNLASIARTRGLDPAEAARRLARATTLPDPETDL